MKNNANSNQKIDIFINIAVGVVATQILVASLFIAVKKPWVKAYYEAIEPYQTGSGINKPPNKPKALTSVTDRVNLYVYHLYQTTIPEISEYDTDIKCLQSIIGIDNDSLASAVRYIDTYYNYGKNGNPEYKLGDIATRINLLFGSSTFNSHFFGRGNRAIEDHIKYSSLRGMVGSNFADSKKSKITAQIGACSTPRSATNPGAKESSKIGL